MALIAVRPIINAMVGATTMLAALAKQSAQFCDIMRYKTVLIGHDGRSGCDVADALGLHVDTVRKRRNRFLPDGIDGLKDATRSGKPRAYDPRKVRNDIMETLKKPSPKALPSGSPRPRR